MPAEAQRELLGAGPDAVLSHRSAAALWAIAWLECGDAQLAASPQVAVLQQAVQAFGLTFTVRSRPEVTLPAYSAPLDLRYASPR